MLEDLSRIDFVAKKGKGKIPCYEANEKEIAEEGGETVIADSRHVYNSIDMNIINKFNEKKVLYVRNYTEGIDLSWQEVFQTEDKKEVEQYCKNHSINYEWKTGDLVLTTKQICQATIKHPLTKENVWFKSSSSVSYLCFTSTRQKRANGITWQR